MQLRKLDHISVSLRISRGDTLQLGSCPRKSSRDSLNKWVIPVQIDGLAASRDPVVLHYLSKPGVVGSLASQSGRPTTQITD